jgi:hypothetical protein
MDQGKNCAGGSLRLHYFALCCARRRCGREFHQRMPTVKTIALTHVELGEFYGLWGIWLMSQVLWWFGDFYGFWGLNGAFEASNVIKRGYSWKNPDKWRFLGGKIIYKWRTFKQTTCDCRRVATDNCHVCRWFICWRFSSSALENPSFEGFQQWLWEFHTYWVVSGASLNCETEDYLDGPWS